MDSARSSHSAGGERRVVTILFCDVKDSTLNAGSLDPEDWTEIMNGAFEFMIKPVYQYGGIVARLMGDAVLAFFGAPVTHEDDPQRAVLAGLGIVDDIQAYRVQVQQQWDIEFNVRVGINTGLVVVGEVGSDLRAEYTAMGDAINLAARMEQTAQPGTVQVAEETYQLVASLFDFDDLGEIAVKGKTEPVHTYRAVRSKDDPRRSRGIVGLEAPLVGRTREKAILEGCLKDLEKGLGGIFYLVGEAGIGKSRLLHEVLYAGKNQPAVNILETLSLSYETEKPYSLFRRLILHGIGASPEESPEEIRAKLHHMVADLNIEETVQVQQVFESLFGLPDQDGEPPLEGETFRGLLYKWTAALCSHLAESGPLVVVCDDLHWSDPASVALLQHLYPLTNTIAFLLVCVLRPERDAPAWSAMQSAERDFPHRYREVRLQSLNAEESSTLIDSLLKISDFPGTLRKLILEKSEGNPYFVEEVIRTLIDQGVIVKDESGGRWQASGDGSDLDIPDNLQTLLIARIDRLAEAHRRTLQVAAVVGRSFYFRVLQRVADISANLDQQLLTLQQKQLILEAARLPEREYLFRHALLQEAAYTTILLKQRRQFHREVGEALESLFPDQLHELAGTLATHFLQAQVFPRALHYYIIAGDAAFRLFALGEALTSYKQAIDLSEQGGATSLQLIHLYRQYGRTLELLLRHDEALKAYQDLEALGDSRKDDTLRLAGISAQGMIYYLGKADREKSTLLTEKALTLARRLNDRSVEARCLWMLLVSNSWYDPLQALEYGEEALQIASEITSGQNAASEDQELLAFILVDLSLVHTNIGQMKLASERAKQAQFSFEDLGNRPMTATAIERIAFIQAAEGRLELAVKMFTQGIKMDQSIGNRGGVISKHSNLLFQEIHPRLGDFSEFFAILEEYKTTPLAVESMHRDFQEIFIELYPVVAFSYFGDLDQIQQMEGPLLQFLETGLYTFPPSMLIHAALAHIRSGNLEKGQELLERCEAHPRIENYILPLNANLTQTRAELWLAEGKYNQALELIESYLISAHKVGVKGYDAPELFLKGRILLKSSQTEEAYATFKEAHSLASEQKERAVLWKICIQLSKMEAERGNLDTARALMEEARVTITFILDHAGREDLRLKFLLLPEVQQALETNPNT